MDFLISPHHRWIYVAIFGVMAVNLFWLFNLVDVDNVFLWLFLNLSKHSDNINTVYPTHNVILSVTFCMLALRPMYITICNLP